MKKSLPNPYLLIGARILVAMVVIVLLTRCQPPDSVSTLPESSQTTQTGNITAFVIGNSFANVARYVDPVNAKVCYVAFNEAGVYIDCP